MFYIEFRFLFIKIFSTFTLNGNIGTLTKTWSFCVEDFKLNDILFRFSREQEKLNRSINLKFQRLTYIIIIWLLPNTEHQTLTELNTSILISLFLRFAWDIRLQLIYQIYSNVMHTPIVYCIHVYIEQISHVRANECVLNWSWPIRIGFGWIISGLFFFIIEEANWICISMI